MPRTLRSAPTNRTLLTCVEKYEKQATTKTVTTVWKNFRDSKCGHEWLDELHRAYGHRCLYCDHGPATTIDHRDAKTRTVAHAFTWDNHRPSCGDCNRDKGTKAVADPLTEDPHTFVVFDVDTGKPDVSPEADPGQQAKAGDTRRLLDRFAFNEARRKKVRDVTETMRRFLDGERGYDEARVFAELHERESHRAVVRDLILDAEQGLHGWSALVCSVTQRIPRLKAWALTPVTRPRRARRS